MRLLVEKGRAAEIREVAAEFEALVAAQANVLDVELTTAHELSDEEFGRIVGRIEQASGRKVQATRQRRPGPDRRPRPPGRIDAPRRERARPARPPSHGARDRQMNLSHRIE